MNPIAYFKDGLIHVRQTNGSYKVDETPLWCLSTLDTLKTGALEYRTEQDNRSIQELQTMFRERREYENQKGESE